MYTLEITLKQHTPLIHFQHDQDGATLRASEVKPKLDKFIIKNIFDNEFDACKQYLVGYSRQKESEVRKKFKDGFRALDYKIKVVTFDTQEKVSLKTIPKNNERDGTTKYCTEFNKEEFPFLLSNMGGKESPEELINLVLHDYILLEFITKHGCIRENLIKCVISFFSRNNFGQRKTKGFGSFTVAEIEGSSIEWNKPLVPSDTPYMTFSVKNQTGTLNKQHVLFKTLDFYWKCLKSGINYTQKKDSDEVKLRYIKAYYWHYLNERGYTWEKKSIKTHFNLLTGNETHATQPLPTSYARALLGGSDKYEYRDRLRRFTQRNIKIKHNETNKEDSIDRIPSPIIFKPIVCGDKVTIYILFDLTIRKKLRKHTNLCYKFSDGGNRPPLYLDIDPNIIDSYKNMILSYHQYFTKNSNVFKSVFYGIEQNDISDSMVPRDFRWDNILGEEEIVIFSKTD